MKNIILFSVIALLFIRCSEDTFDPSQSFFKIYDTQRSDAEFRPIDIVSTAEGFIVLGEKKNETSNFMELQVFQMNEFGNFQIETAVPGEHFAPVGEFISIDSSHYFFTMDGQQNAQLVKMGSDPSVAEVISLTGGLQYPLAANKTAGGELLLLSYNSNNAQTLLSTIDTLGNFNGGNAFSIGAGNDPADMEQRIRQHFEYPDRWRQPFFCGSTGIGTYYFNGFYNFNLSLVFTDLSSSTPTGVVQGQLDDGGIASALPLAANTFSIVGFQFNDIFIRPIQTIAPTDISSSIQFFEESLAFNEFKSRTPAIIRPYTTTDGTIYSIIAAESQSRSVVLYIYNAATGELSGIHSIGQINPYTLGSIKVDADNNLVILGTTLVSGRLERLFINKLSAEEMESIIN